MDLIIQVNDGVFFDILVYGKLNCISMLVSVIRILLLMINGSVVEMFVIRWFIMLLFCIFCLLSFMLLFVVKSCEFVGNLLKIWLIFFNVWEMVIL